MAQALYLVIHVRDFAVQALTQAHKNAELHTRPVAVMSGEAPLERVFAANEGARRLGLEMGMSRVQAESFGVAVLRRDRRQEDAAFTELMACAGKFSPRIEAVAAPEEESCGATLVLDASGCERLLGEARQMAAGVHKAVRAAGFAASVAAVHNAYAAVLAARGREGVTVIAGGREAEMLAPLPLSVLELDEAEAETFAAWGITTLGQLAALPAKALAARVGERGLRLQALARGEAGHLLVPEEEPADAVLSERVELEHAVELLEPLLFLLSRMLEQVTQRAGERALAIAEIQTSLAMDGGDGRQRELRRTVRPALPERDHHTLLKLVQLDLELHPPEAPVTALRVEARPAKAQRAQQGLFAAQAPEAGRLEVLLARLRKLVGEGRAGAPQLLDSHAPEAFRMAPFGAQAGGMDGPSRSAGRASALRVVRPPRAVRCELRNRAPATLYYEGQRLQVREGSGPWRTDGGWWTSPAWSREEWDVVLEEQPRRCLRLAFDPGANCWYVIGAYD